MSSESIICSEKTPKRKCTNPIRTSTIEIFLCELPVDILNQIIGTDFDAPIRRTDLVTDGEETLRLLTAKKAVLSNKDNPKTRAGLVVDYLCRHTQSDRSKRYRQTTIPIQVLSNTLKLKGKKNVQQMQALLESYLDDSFKRNSKQLLQEKSTIAEKLSLPNSETLSLDDRMLSDRPTNLIQELSIRLGPMISDATCAVTFAAKLFHTLTTQQHGLILKDVARYTEYYEAACLFLAVRRIDGSNACVKRSNSNNSDRKFRSPSLTNEQYEGDEEDVTNDDHHILNEKDFIIAANLKEGIFKQVLETTKESTQNVRLSWSVEKPPFELIDPGPKSFEDDQETSYRKKNAERMHPLNDDNSTTQCKQNDPFKEEYHIWKQKVLEEAKNSALAHYLQMEGTTSSVPDEKQLLHFAANAVVCRFNPAQ